MSPAEAPLTPPMAAQTLPLRLLGAGGAPMLQVPQDGLQWSSSGYSQNELGRKILIRVVLQVLHSRVWRSHTHCGMGSSRFLHPG